MGEGCREGSSGYSKHNFFFFFFFFSPKAGSDNFNSLIKSIENALKNIDKQMGGNQTSGITQAILENLIMPPTSKKLTGHIGFVLCVRASVRPSVRSSRTVHARVLKFHIWIRHGKIADTRFLFLLLLFIFLVRVISLPELCPFEKLRMKSNACRIL